MAWHCTRCVVLCIAFTCFILHSIAALCPTSWIPDFHGSCFKMFSEGMGWNAAKSFCVALETNLATLNSQAKVASVSSNLGKWAWIALHRDPKNGSRWLWIDGSLTNYTNWGNYQPNHDAGGMEDCVATKAGEKWHARACTKSYCPICEISGK